MASFKAKFPVLQELFAKNHRGRGLTRAPLAIKIFHHLLGRGGGDWEGWCSNTPRLSRLLLVVEKNGKNVRKLVNNDYETISVNFSLNLRTARGAVIRPPQVTLT